MKLFSSVRSFSACPFAVVLLIVRCAHMAAPSNSAQNYELPKEQTVLAILRKFGVVRAQLFGSAARGELTPNSDIDLLVELDGKVDYGKLLLLSEELEAATGRRFDVLTSIKEVFRPYIEPELVELPL